jgi:GTP-binding protein HflX
MPARQLIELAVPAEKAFLVAVDTGDDAGWSAEESLAELANLATTAGAEVVGAEWQNRRHADPNWYIGKGKAEELSKAKSETGFDLLVADDELSPSQQKALESLLNVKVIDRSRLILDIFAQHAQTHEGRLQVELAQRLLGAPAGVVAGVDRDEEGLFRRRGEIDHMSGGHRGRIPVASRLAHST